MHRLWFRLYTVGGVGKPGMGSCLVGLVYNLIPLNRTEPTGIIALNDLFFSLQLIDLVYIHFLSNPQRSMYYRYFKYFN